MLSSTVCSGAQLLWKLLSHHMIISDGDVVWSGHSHCVQEEQTHENNIFENYFKKKEPSGCEILYEGHFRF